MATLISAVRSGKYPGLVVTLLCSLFIAGTAFAEGSFTSYMDNAYRGFGSRTWSDYHNDRNATTVRFDDCRDTLTSNNPNDWAEVELRKEFVGQDENRGRRRFYCFVSGTGNFGEQPDGAFHFDLYNHSGPSWMDVPWLQVRY